MSSSKKVPAYPVGKKGGRPTPWNQEKIEAEADYLVQWAKKEDSLVLGDCYGSRGYDYDRAIGWAEKYEKFNEAKKLAMTIVGARRERMGLLKLLDSGVVKSSMHHYDPDFKNSTLALKLADVSKKMDDTMHFLKFFQDHIEINKDPIKK